jgi:putative aldouronate transport system permease protein
MVARKKIKKHLKNEWGYHLMLLPGVILVFIFSYIPLYGVVIAFQDYNPALGFASPWVGLKNFMFVFSQPDFVRTIWNTFYITIFKILGNIAVPVIFALLLNEVKNVFFKRTMQTLIYIPNFISWVIMAGILMDILATDGAVNRCINLLGGGTVNFLGNAKIYPWTMIISDIWKSFGYGTIIYLAALTAIDPTLYEAASIDGATRWQRVKMITFPLLVPTIILMLVLSLGNVLNAGFDQIYNTISPIVYSSGDIIDTYVYRLGIQQAQFDVGAAVGLFKSAVSSVLVVLSYVLADKLAGYRIL